MRKLQYVFMALAALCFASSGLRGWRLGRRQPGADRRRHRHGPGGRLCGLGQGRAVGSATEALARNPGARAGISCLLILGLAFIESLTLFTFAMIFIKVK